MKKNVVETWNRFLKHEKKSTDFDIDNGWILFHKINSNILSIWVFEIDVIYQKFNVDF